MYVRSNWLHPKSNQTHKLHRHTFLLICFSYIHFLINSKIVPWNLFLFWFTKPRLKKLLWNFKIIMPMDFPEKEYNLLFNVLAVFLSICQVKKSIQIWTIMNFIAVRTSQVFFIFSGRKAKLYTMKYLQTENILVRKGSCLAWLLFITIKILCRTKSQKNKSAIWSQWAFYVKIIYEYIYLSWKKVYIKFFIWASSFHITNVLSVQWPAKQLLLPHLLPLPNVTTVKLKYSQSWEFSPAPSG